VKEDYRRNIYMSPEAYAGVVAREANTAENIGFKDAEPVSVSDVGEVLGFIDTQIVDEDVYIGNLLDESIDPAGCGRAGNDHLNSTECLIQFVLAPAGNCDRYAFACKSSYDGEADASGASVKKDKESAASF
jgi:hypothetical protein